MHPRCHFTKLRLETCDSCSFQSAEPLGRPSSQSGIPRPKSGGGGPVPPQLSTRPAEAKREEALGFPPPRFLWQGSKCSELQYYGDKLSNTYKWKVLATQSCLALCDPMDYSPLGSSVHGIPQARILEWVAFPFSRRSSQPRNWTRVSCNAGRFFTSWATREYQEVRISLLKFSFSKLCDLGLVFDQPSHLTSHLNFLLLICEMEVVSDLSTLYTHWEH